MLSLAAGALSAQEITLFLLAMGLLLGFAKLLGEAARAFGQPAVLGEILAGVILGPTLLGGFFPGIYTALFPSEGANYIALEAFITLAVVLLLLVAGIEVDLSSVWRQGSAAVLVGGLGMIIPGLMGFGLAWTLPDLMGLEASQEKFPFALFLGIALSITALSVIAKILMDLNMAKSDVGSLILSAAMLNDLLGWIGFAILLALVTVQTDGGALTAGTLVWQVGPTVVLALAFLGFALTLGRWLVHKSLPFVQAHSTWPGGVIVFVFVITIACAAFTEWVGVHAIFGAFIAGVVVGDSSHLRERTRDTVHQFVLNIFAPLFFASIGLRVNFIESFDLVMVLLVTVVACVGKIGGCYLGAKLGGIQQREAWAVGSGMVARGGMEIILAQFAFSLGLIGEQLFVTIVIMALVTSLIAGPGIRFFLRTKQRRALRQMVTDKTFIPRLEARTRLGAVRELSKRAGAILNLPHETVFNAVWERELIMPTGLEHNVAVPHARLDNIQRSYVIVGVSDHGLDFDSPDGEPAHIICFLLTPSHDPTAQLELLDMVSRAFANPEARHLTMAARTFTEFRAALSVTAPEAEPEGKQPPSSPPNNHVADRVQKEQAESPPEAPKHGDKSDQTA